MLTWHVVVLCAVYFQVKPLKQPNIRFLLITILFHLSGYRLKKRTAMLLLTLTPAKAPCSRFDKFTLKEVRRLSAESAFHRL